MIMDYERIKLIKIYLLLDYLFQNILEILDLEDLYSPLSK